MIKKEKKRKWISLFMIVIGLPFSVRYVQFGSGNEANETDNPTTISILSYNVRLFDLYNWKNAENEITRDNIYKFLKEEDADIMCFQEYYANDLGRFAAVSHIVKIQKTGYHHIVYTSSIGRSHWGISTFSKYPIIKKGRVKFSEKSNNICIFSDIVIGQDTVRVYNAHLGSIHFGYEEYDLLQSVGKDEGSRDSSGPTGTSQQIEKAKNSDASFIDVVKSMIKLLRNAFVNRADQASAVSEHAAASPYPVIICGDINDTPVSYSYKRLSEDRQDAFIEAGSGFGNSYAGVVPFFRIDYIFCDKAIQILDFTTKSDITYSDHYPLSCSVSL